MSVRRGWSASSRTCRPCTHGTTSQTSCYIASEERGVWGGVHHLSRNMTENSFPVTFNLPFFTTTWLATLSHYHKFAFHEKEYSTFFFIHSPILHTNILHTNSYITTSPPSPTQPSYLPPLLPPLTQQNKQTNKEKKTR